MYTVGLGNTWILTNCAQNLPDIKPICKISHKETKP